ncbi:MAG TPA: tetrathionate reductase family octaheme c-type cytochrome [Myxococcota bacterium]|nr:tetrathionate reductase family octaheme c-type cytochrome [Myxococcota bacterium]HRY91999.1 tetrathionate reductase family octaheme c-type cytochrome [Myxococcota bacterium]
MSARRAGWAAAVLALALVGALAWTLVPARAEADRPREHLRPRLTPTDHSGLFEGKRFADGPAVTRACLECHPRAAEELMQTSHWLWLGDPEVVPGHQEPVRIGKRNLINNFCISIEGNWPRCTICHAGYGWRDASFDFSRAELVDCLVCHDRSGTYSKGASGLPAEGVDLLAAARSVGRPGRDNCGACHFSGGGGDAVKHGDLDGSLARPVERVDVHMGREDFACTECHRTEHHRIRGRMISVSATDTNQFGCTACHAARPHASTRLNDHLSAVACQTCHLPEVARSLPTKVVWDWSTAGADVPQADPHHYMKIKGSFVYQTGLVPEYGWFNGDVARYLKGDPIDPTAVVHINKPQGDIHDPRALIWPFKIHRGKQPYDVEHRVLLVPKTVGQDGYWTTFDWGQALALGAQAAGLPFSGKFAFAETDMHWNLNHMVAPKGRSLQCTDCHTEGGRMDWRALGYPGDPARMGGRVMRRLVAGPQGVEP